MKREPKKKTHIIEAAESLFQKFGIKKVTVEEICREASASKMTFYKYFPNKIELVKYMWQQKVDDSMAKLDELEQKNTPFTDKVKLILKMKEESTTNMGNQYIRDYLNLMPELQEFYNQAFAKGMQRFMIIIKHAQEKGEVRRSMRPEFFFAVVNMMMELAKNDQLAAIYDNYTDFALEINNFLYYGLMPAPEEENLSACLSVPKIGTQADQ
ncbi:TetR/AcrR family transcriptional regulator [bacterium]|nr:TetR/AcrR family transcriptional regulator [bacterium]MBU1064683.1 TetR/AcrR family transcriptional regulator [bacterium]MBU1634945.1 TetR/AcrR family transcriptional regulator [bacterium]MBU1875351.1 TetR/AcrR family transcriptional regulator [bacterium]